MSVMSSPTNRRRYVYLSRFSIVLALGLIIAASVLIVWRNHAQKVQAMRASLVGTWATDLGAIVQLRPDGEARIRHPKSTNVAVSSYGWEIKKDSLVLVRPARAPGTTIGKIRKAASRVLGFNNYAEQLEIVEVTADRASLQERGPPKKPTRWTRSDDKILDLAP